MRRFWLVLLGAGDAANGLAMLLAPELWYRLTPGVTDTGPYNLHFIRDIGCAYLVCGAALLWLLRDARAWPAAMIAGVFQLLHAATHVLDAFAGRVTLPHLASDVALVILPAFATLALAWPRKPTE